MDGSVRLPPAETTEDEAWKLTSQSNNEQLLRSFLTTYPYSPHRAEALKKLRWQQVKNRVFWGAAAITPPTVIRSRSIAGMIPYCE